MPPGTPITEEDRESIVRMRQNGLSFKNIAASLGISPKSVGAVLVSMGLVQVSRRQAEIKPDVKWVHPESLGIDENWETQGLCRVGGYDPDLWFPSPTEFSLVKLAQKVCYRCPVIMECRSTAIARGERNGIWGGLTEAQRKRIRKGKVPHFNEEEEAAAG